jgi:hypothetical protein
MANPTYKLIASQVVGSGGASSITFSNIPQTFTDLKIVCSVNDGGSGNGIYYQMGNGTVDTTSGNYAYMYIQGTGTASTAGQNTSTTVNYAGIVDAGNSSAFGTVEIYIPNYTTSNTKPSFTDSVSEANATNAYAQLQSNVWKGTSAVNIIKLTPTSGSFIQYSTFYLYGINNS